MSPQQALLEPHGEKMDSHQKFAQLYKSISDVCKELVPLETKVLKYGEKLKEGKISPFEAELLKADMNKVLGFYDKLEKASDDIRELRKLNPDDQQNEINAIIETKTYISIEGMRAHSRMMGSETSHERLKHAETMEGLSLAEDIIAGHISEMGVEFEKIKRELSARKLE
jgi:hypothetical protein